MDKYKLSIIIPMYNVEKYIGNCLESIINSDLPSKIYEIVIVNDGSTDSGSEIAQKYSLKYENISYITQENQGQSTARNNGINNCHGEYVWCVDADDKLDHHLTEIINLLNENDGIDILAFKLKKVTEDMVFKSIECEQPTVRHNKIIKGRDAIIYGYNPSSVCALAIRKDFILKNNLFFKAGITHQDVELSYRLFTYAENTYFSDLVPYIYIIHKSSTSQSVRPEKKIKYLSDEIRIIQSFEKLAETIKSDKELHAAIIKRIKNIHFGLVFNLYQNRAIWKPLCINSAVIEKMKVAGLYPLRGDFGNIKKNILKYLLNIKILLY